MIHLPYKVGKLGSLSSNKLRIVVQAYGGTLIQKGIPHQEEFDIFSTLRVPYHLLYNSLMIVGALSNTYQTFKLIVIILVQMMAVIFRLFMTSLLGMVFDWYDGLPNGLLVYFLL